MKLTPFLVVWFGAFVLLGCSEQESPDPASSTLTKVSAREPRNQARETAQAADQVSTENKEQFLASMEVKLNECGQKIAAFDTRLASLASDYNAKAEGTKALDALREKRTQLGQQLEKLRQCSHETWQEAKAAVDAAEAEADKAYENAKSRFKD